VEFYFLDLFQRDKKETPFKPTFHFIFSCYTVFMYLTSKAFYLILSLALLVIGGITASSLTTASRTIAINSTPAGKINLMPLSSVQSVRASDVAAETPAAPAPEPVAQAAAEPAPQPASKATPTRAPAPKPVVKAATASVQPAPAPTVTCSGGLAAEFLCLLNQYRASKGLGKLSGSSALSKVALGHSTWMSTTGIFSHVGIDGSRLGERCAAAGITCRGENLAHNIGTAKGLLDSWKASPGHNANLLGSYTTAGMGVYGGYTTLLFN
jgi:uncharacterized protein YkwD